MPNGVPHAAEGSSSSSSSSSSLEANLEISSLLLPHLDRHLALPVLNFLEEHTVYPKDEVLQAKLELLQPTNMVHYLDSVRKELNGDSSNVVSAEVKTRADQIVERRDELREKADQVIAIISNPQVAAALGQDKERNLATLKEKYGVSFLLLLCLLFVCVPFHLFPGAIQNSFVANGGG